MQPNPEEVPPVTRVMFGGDVMLGRLVKNAILRFGRSYPLAPIAPMMRAADLTVINLECALTSGVERWPGAHKAYYFGAPPQAIDALREAGVDMVSLANNHVLDFGIGGLRETLELLHQHDMSFAGAGETLAEACSAAIVKRHCMRFGMVAFCDHQADFAASPERPGIAHIDSDDETGTITLFRNALERMQAQAVDWPILSLHWGPNMVFRPAPKFRRLARAAIIMGWKMVYGHSAHVFQGIELVQGCPIIYAAGDLVDDYHVDPHFMNDHQLLFELKFDGSTLRSIALHPVVIRHCQVRPADADQTLLIAKWMTRVSLEMGTRVKSDGGTLCIDCAGT